MEAKPPGRSVRVKQGMYDKDLEQGTQEKNITRSGDVGLHFPSNIDQKYLWKARTTGTWSISTGPKVARHLRTSTSVFFRVFCRTQLTPDRNTNQTLRRTGCLERKSGIPEKELAMGPPSGNECIRVAKRDVLPQNVSSNTPKHRPCV